MIGRFLCRVGLHRSNYSGIVISFAPQSVRCERCRKVLHRG